MLSMWKRHEIQVLTKAGHTLDDVAVRAGVSRRSVARIVQEPPIEHVDDEAERERREVGRPSKVEGFRKSVRKILEETPALPSVEILRRARLEGYQGQKSALYQLIKELRPARVELVTRFEAVPGEFTQHDFGEVKVTYLDGTVENVIFFATRLKFSRWAQVSLVPNQRAETLVRACCEHFEAIGGIPLLAVFDRPKTVAIEWKADGTITKWNPLFQQAMCDIGVLLEVCWPHAPEQKGAVENLVGWVKGSFFKVRRFQDHDDLEAQLREWHHESNVERPSRATGEPPALRIEAERTRLRPLKVQPHELAVRRPIHVGPTAMISLDGSQYSMPPESAGISGTAYLYFDRVRFEAGRYQAEHRRATAPGAKSTLPEHRSARLATISGRRGRQYLKRQDLLDLGEVSMTLISEIVHRRPRSWSDDIDVLHDLLQTYGDGLLRLAMHMAIAAGDFSAEAVTVQLVTAATGSPRGIAC
jgi:transposase